MIPTAKLSFQLHMSSRLLLLLVLLVPLLLLLAWISGVCTPRAHGIVCSQVSSSMRQPKWPVANKKGWSDGAADLKLPCHEGITTKARKQTPPIA